MKDVCDEMGTVEYASALTRFSAEQPNFQKLLTEVLLCEEETYRYFIEVADSCSLLLERFFSSMWNCFRFSLFGSVKVKIVYHIKLGKTVSPSPAHDQLDQTDH